MTLDRRTLRARGRILRLHDDVGGDAAATSAVGQLSPDGKTLAVGGTLGQIVLIDPARLRRLGAIRLPRGSDVVDVDSWPRPDRLLVVYGRFSVHNPWGDSLAVVDPLARRVLRRTRLFGFANDAEKLRDGSLVFLVSPLRAPETTRVVVVSPAGRLRAVTLHAGFSSVATDGVARAFVVEDSGAVQEIDLRSLRVRTHRVTLTRRSLGLPRPPARVPGTSEPRLVRARNPVWLGHGLLGVSGGVDRPVRLGRELGMQYMPYAFQVLSTRTWRTVKILPLTSCEAAFGLYLCSASVGGFAPDGKGSRGSTLIAYDRRWQLLYRKRAPALWREEIAGRLLAGHADGSSIWQLDPRTGVVTRRFGRFRVWPPELLDWRSG